MANDSKTDRQDILRGVYEENKRIGDRFRARASAPTARTYATGVGGVILLVIVLILATEYVFQDRRFGTTGGADRTALAGDSKLARINSSGSSSGIAPSHDIPVASESIPESGDIPASGAYGAIVSAPLPLSQLFDLEVRTIVIDAGHGGRDPGALGSAGLMEKEITLDVALRLARRLTENHGIHVALTRDGDQTRSLKARADFTNEKRADLFVSIHVNQFPEEPVYALETYYFGAQSSASALRLAELENKNSDYSVAEFNVMIRRIGDRLKLEESKRLALHVQRSLFRNTRDLNGKVKNWGVKTAPFIVLVGAQAPGILSEIGVISNSDEEARLRTPEYREELALFLEEGIVTYLNELSDQEASQNGVTENATEEDVDS